MKVQVFLLAALVGIVLGKFDPNFAPGHGGIVHLFEWKFTDIANECERYLGPRGFGGVQLSPVSENVIVQLGKGRPWWERYQPVSYKIISRSGDEQDFLDMSRRCNAVGVRLYVDVILNHMAIHPAELGDRVGLGVGGSIAYPGEREFPGVPFTREDFNEPCELTNFTDPVQLRNCDLLGLPDLNQALPSVRDRSVEFLNRLIDLGVAGFRVDAAKHMWPEDMEVIFSRLKDLDTSYGFPAGSRAFFTQEVIDMGSQEGIRKYEYTHMGTVTEFMFSSFIGRAFSGNDFLARLQNFGEEWGLLPSEEALVFVDNHDNQRGHGTGSDDSNILTHKVPRSYKMATAFAAAFPYGELRIMSSFFFTDSDQGPPEDINNNIISPSINTDGSCGNGWVCEHRWPAIANMIHFRNLCRGTPLVNWWSNGQNQIAFGRGSCGFVAFNNERQDGMMQVLQTGMPAGVYCDVISGEKVGNSCTGKSIEVLADGSALFEIARDATDGVVAIHIQGRL